jgi:thymidine phosphorylase
MGVDQGWEKFFITLHFAVASPALLQRRLAEVAQSVCRLERDSFPDGETWNRFEKFIAATAGLPANNENTAVIEVTTSQMTDDEASYWLQEAFGICNDITVAYGAEVARLAAGRCSRSW